MSDIASIGSDFLLGLGLNLLLAASALLGGIFFGALLAIPAFLNRKTPILISCFVWLLKAIPSFVLMFVVMFVLFQSSLTGEKNAFWVPFAAVVASLVPFSAAYCADAFIDLARQLRIGRAREALLIFPNLVRCFVVLIISSGAAAAVGLPDAVSVLLVESNQLQSTGAKLALLLSGTCVFMVIVQSLYLAADNVKRMILQRFDNQDAQGTQPVLVKRAAA